MADRKTAVLAMVGRVRRVERYVPGWSVQQEDSLNGAYRVTKTETPESPTAGRVQMHLTPRDKNHMDTIQRDLAALGFDEAEALATKLEEDDRKRRLSEDAEKNNRRLARAEKEAAQREAVARAAGPYAPAAVTIDQILGEHPAPFTYHRVLVNQDMARAMLERNHPTEKAPWPNRKVYAKDVAIWVSILRTGRWRYTHQGISFDWDGRLQDGQNRLTAIAECGIPAELMISVGMDPDNFAVVDGQRKRTSGQVLQMDGVKNANSTAPAVRMIYLYEVWGKAMFEHDRQRVPNDIIRDVRRSLDQDEFEWALKSAYRLRAEISGRVSSPAAAFYLIARRLPANDPRVAQFVDQMIHDVEGADKDASPVHQVRRQLLRQATGAIRKLTAAESLALIIKGWNAFAQGNYKGRNLYVRGDSAMPAIFLPPPVDGSDDEDEQEAEVSEAVIAA
jgi:hypothetical protein